MQDNDEILEKAAGTIVATNPDNALFNFLMLSSLSFNGITFIFFDLDCFGGQDT